MFFLESAEGLERERKERGREERREGREGTERRELEVKRTQPSPRERSYVGVLHSNNLTDRKPRTKDQI